MIIIIFLQCLFLALIAIKITFSWLTTLASTLKPYTKSFLKKYPKMTYTLIACGIALFVYSVSGKFSNYCLLTFFLLSTFRYLRLIVNIISFACLKGRPVNQTNPAFTHEDVSVVVPTVFANSAEVIDCLRRVRVCKPKQIIVVTKDDLVDKVNAACAEATSQAVTEDQKLDNVQVIGVEKLNKRTQMVTALQQAVKGKIVAFADDDVFWPGSDFIKVMLACFEDPKVGAAGPSQRVQRSVGKDQDTSLWNFLGICYLERRNFNTGATNHIDGAVSTLSGRTSFYRASLITSPEFYDFFLNAANHDDDKNLTRWVYDSGYQITLQFDPAARIETTLETTRPLFIKQCMRWARGHWRGNFRVMKTTTYWYDTHIWSLYAIYISQFQTPAFFIDGSLITSLYYGMVNYDNSTRKIAVAALVSWILFTKIVKIIPHFREFPQDIKWIPAMIAFSYAHGIMNVYALLTMENKAWGR